GIRAVDGSGHGPGSRSSWSRRWPPPQPSPAGGGGSRPARLGAAPFVAGRWSRCLRVRSCLSPPLPESRPARPGHRAVSCLEVVRAGRVAAACSGLPPSSACGGGSGWGQASGATRSATFVAPTSTALPFMPKLLRQVLHACVPFLLAALFTACAGTPAGGVGGDRLATTGLEADAGAGAAITGRYPNLFAEAGYAQADIDAKIQASFAQLFHGDPQDQAIYHDAGSNADGPLAYILDVNSDDVRSEGMSYGMMIAVQLDRKREFDAIWNWAKTHTYHADPAHPAHGYFAWSVKTDGTAIDEMPAPDGEEYFITALYFASARWGDGEGIYDYRAQADRLLGDVLHREPITGPTNRGTMTAVNLFDRDARMVRFTPDVVNAAHTDASYHLPAFYEVWARVGPEADRAFWAEAARVSRDYFVAAAHPLTALTPDYGNFDGSPWAASWRPESA